MAKLYIYLHKKYVTKIMIKNEKEQLIQLLKNHSTVYVEIPTDLE